MVKALVLYWEDDEPEYNPRIEIVTQHKGYTIIKIDSKEYLITKSGVAVELHN